MTTWQCVAALCLALVQVVRVGNTAGDSEERRAPLETKITSQPAIAMRAFMTVPGVTYAASGSPSSFAFGEGRVDPRRSLYVLSDQTTGAVDVFDLNRNVFERRISEGLCSLCRFTGVDPTSSAAKSGPNGIALVEGSSLAWVGDVGSVKLVDYVKGTILRSIAIVEANQLESRFRSAHICYAAKDRMLMVVNPDDATPFISFIDTRSNTVVGRFDFPNALGLGGCVYRPKDRRFYVANAGSPQWQTGALFNFPTADIRSGTFHESAYGFAACSPRGLAFDEIETEMLIACDLDATLTPRFQRVADRIPLETARFDARSRRMLDPVLQVGGAEDVAYDPYLKRWYLAAWRMTDDGFADGIPTPALEIIDAEKNTLIARVPTDSEAHCVAVNVRTGFVYVPIQQSASSGAGVMVLSPPRTTSSRSIPHPLLKRI